MRIKLSSCPFPYAGVLFLACGLVAGPARAADAPAAPARAAASAAPAASAEPEAPEPPAVEPEKERASSESDEFRFGTSVTVPAGETRHSNLVVFGGAVAIEGTHDGDLTVFGGQVTISGTQRGDVVVTGGGLEVSGRVEGKIAVIGGGARLTSTANVSGDLSVVGGSLDREPGSVLDGGNVSVAAPSAPALPGLPFGVLGGLGGLAAGFTFFNWLKSFLLTLIVGLLVITLLPARIEAAGVVLRERWLHCLGVGFLAGLAVIPLMLVLLVTCIGVVIPPIFYQVAKYFGLTVLFIVLGETLGRGAFKRELSPIASFLLGFAVLSVVAFVTPLPTWMICGWFGVGCALLTRFGTMRPWFQKKTPAVPPEPAAPVELSVPSTSEPTSQE